MDCLEFINIWLGSEIAEHRVHVYQQVQYIRCGEGLGLKGIRCDGEVVDGPESQK